MTDTPNEWTDKDLEQLSRIAPSAGAPSEWGELQMEAIHGAVARGYCHEGNRHKELDGTLLKAISIEVSALLDAECKAAVAAALEQANKEFWRVWHKQSVGTPIAVAVTHSIDAATSALSPDPNYIALREAEARLEVLPKLGLLPEPLASQVAEYQAALVEARDKLKEKAK